MREITILLPDEFTDEQVEYIKKLAILQVEAEIRKELKISQGQIDACELKIAKVKKAMELKEVKPKDVL